MKSKTTRIVCGVGAALCALLLISMSVFPIIAGQAWVMLMEFFTKMTQTTPSGTIGDVIAAILFFPIFIIPAATFSGLLWLVLKPHKKTVVYSLLASGCVSILTTVFLLIKPYTPFEMYILYFFGTALGSFGCIGCILLYGWLKKKLPAVFNRETISYIVFGVLTTVVSFVSQMLFSSLGWHVTVNTIGSWVCAVLFAYVVNKLFVFESKTDTAKAFWREFGLFIGARVASLGMELVFMFVTVELLNFSEAICKLIAQVFILVANYVFSKLVIFKKK